MKLIASLKDIVSVDGDIEVGCLVRSNKDENATGMIVQFMGPNDVLVLWSTPPKEHQLKFGEIW